MSVEFNQGISPIITLINKSTVSSFNSTFDNLIIALQKYVDTYLAPVWGVSCTLRKGTGFVAGTWAMTFTDNADIAGALGYHDLTPDGLPISKVFVKTSLYYNEPISIVASHELCEMLEDAAINMWAWGPNNLMYAYELADAVEGFSFAVNGFQMSDFVYPSFFEMFRPTLSSSPGINAAFKYDQMGLVKKPFQTLSGGYQIIMGRGSIRLIFGSKEAKQKFEIKNGKNHKEYARNYLRNPRAGKEISTAIMENTQENN